MGKLPELVIVANFVAAYTLQGGLPDKECLICFDDFVEGIACSSICRAG